MDVSLLVILTLSLVCNGVHGVKGISNERDRDNIECVDIYKQPAFDNPLLKDTHKIQMYPSFSLEGETVRASSTFKYSEFDLPSEGCPEGKVPILRTKYANIHPLSKENPGQHFAIVDQVEDPSIYHGAQASIKLENPHVELDQYSAAQIWVQNGIQANLNVIQAGWSVSRNLYGDNVTRLTTQWTADGYKKACFNVECGGFVQIHPKIFLGAKFGRTSVYKGQQYIIYISIVQDRVTRNWWLTLNLNLTLGYWPNEIFTSLADGAKLVRYGGITFCSPDGSCPQMGSGQYATRKFHESGFFMEMKIIYDDYFMGDPDRSKLRYFIDNESCYSIWYFPPKVSAGKGHAFSFGGPGGNDCDSLF